MSWCKQVAEAGRSHRKLSDSSQRQGSYCATGFYADPGEMGWEKVTADSKKADASSGHKIRDYLFKRRDHERVFNLGTILKPRSRPPPSANASGRTGEKPEAGPARFPAS